MIRLLIPAFYAPTNGSSSAVKYKLVLKKIIPFLLARETL